ncbi:MAG TPA: hypothetical protein VMM78_19820, partial [Thermomicrobiales bacterium]|nr:hypothetical protein [Thermomicrobiales bacterium]
MRHVDGCRSPLTLLLLLLTLLSAAVISAPPAGAAESERSGVLHIVHGDPPPGSSAAPITLYTLWEAGDRHTRLTIPNYVIASAGGEQALRQRAVTVRGTARDDARLDVSSITLQQAQPDDGPFMASANALAVSGSQRWYTILCKFSDVSDEPQSQSWFNSLISGSSTSYPGLDHYWREVSYNQSNIGGSTVNGWFNLPQPRSFYVTGSGSSQTADLSALATDCTNAAGGSSVLSG